MCYREIQNFKDYLKKMNSNYRGGETIELTVVMVKQEDAETVPVLIDTSDINVYSISPQWEEIGYSRDYYRNELNLWGKYSTGYNYTFEFSEEDNSLTVKDNGEKILIFKYKN